MAVSVKKLVVGPIEENCYIVHDPEKSGKHCFLIDPGAGGSGILNALTGLGLTPEAIFLTHGHFDHVMAVNWIRKEFPDANLYAWKREKEVFEDPSKSLLSQIPGDYRLSDIRWLCDCEEIVCAGICIRLMGTPGHTCGSCCYYLPEGGVLFSGDTLFKESAGRTDFPTGDGNAIRKSILEHLKPLPEETKVYPGHGEETTIGHEKKYNFVMLGY